MLCRGSVIHIGASRDGFSFDLTCIHVYECIWYVHSPDPSQLIYLSRQSWYKGNIFSTLCKLFNLSGVLRAHMAQNGLQNDPNRCMYQPFV